MNMTNRKQIYAMFFNNVRPKMAWYSRGVLLVRLDRQIQPTEIYWSLELVLRNELEALP